MTKGELLERMSSREISEWVVFYNLEPFGEKRADYRTAMICSIMANAWAGDKNKQFKLEDFLLQFEPSKPQEPKTMQAIAKAFAAITNKPKKGK